LTRPTLAAQTAEGAIITTDKPNHVAWRLLDIAVLLALTAYIFAGFTQVPFHGDESTLIWMSRDYGYIFQSGQLDRVRYSADPVEPTEQHLRFITTSLVKYLVGFAWDLAGYTADDLNEQWDWGADYDWNMRDGHMPAREVLLIARAVSTTMLALGMGVVFALGWALDGRPAAYLASLFYSLHAVVLLNGRRAMFEGSMQAFCLLTLLAALWFLRSRGWLPALLAGLCGGLAISAKQPALFSVGITLGFCLLFLLSRSDLRKEPILYARWIAGSALVPLVFFALHPALWDAPFSRITEALSGRYWMLQFQLEYYGSYHSLIERLAGFWRYVFVAQPQYFEAPGWDAYIGSEIALYQSLPWRGLIIGGTTLGALLLALAALAGLVSLIRARCERPPACALIAFWSAALMLTIFFVTPVGWQRYYMMAYPALGLLAAAGVTHLGRWLAARLSR